MKSKWLSVMLALTMVLSLSACGETSRNNPTTSCPNSPESATEESSEAAPESESVTPASRESIAACFADGPGLREALDDDYRNYYEIFVYSFYDSDGDGIGDLKGVEQNLDYIAGMGFNGIWLMPIMPSPSYHKYDVIDYMEVDPAYGTIEDFESLAAACHERGIRLTIDFVLNHTSSQCAWFQEACEYLKTLDDTADPDPEQCPYVEYYHFDRQPANAVWYPLPGTSWYYEGSFWDQMPDLNLSCEALQKDIEEIASFWIEKGVDGFRMDAALHFEENQPDFNNAALNRLYEYCRAQHPDFYMVSEVWDSAQIIGKYYESLTPSMFDFPLSGVDGAIFKAAAGRGDVSGLVKAMDRIEEIYCGGNPNYIDAPFLSNHDQARIANAFSGDLDSMKMAGGLLMMMSGNPFVYYGEEIGMQSTGLSDENKRLPMNWFPDKNQEGMTEGPEASDHNFLQPAACLAQQLEDPDSLVNYYRRALEIRNHIPEIARGTVDRVESLCVGNQAAITKTWGDSIIGIVYNTGTEPIQINIKDTELIYGELEGILTLHPQETITWNDGVLEMPGRSIAVLK